MASCSHSRVYCYGWHHGIFAGCTSLAASSTPIVNISAGFYQKGRWYLGNSLNCSGNEFRHHCARKRSPLVGWFFVRMFGGASQQCKCTVLTTFSKCNTVVFWNCWVIILGLKRSATPDTCHCPKMLILLNLNNRLGTVQPFWKNVLSESFAHKGTTYLTCRWLCRCERICVHIDIYMDVLR